MKKYTLSLLHLMIAIVCILLFKGCGSTRPEDTTVYYPLIDTHLKEFKAYEAVIGNNTQDGSGTLLGDEILVEEILNNSFRI